MALIGAIVHKITPGNDLQPFVRQVSGDEDCVVDVKHFCSAEIKPDRMPRQDLERLITKNAPYAWGNFYACAITKFQKPQQLGRARIACSSIGTSRELRAEPDLSGQRCCKLAAETTAGESTGKEDLKADHRVCHYKEVGLQEWPPVVEPPSRVFYTVSVSACLFVDERFFQKVYGRPLLSTSPFTLFAR